jgi:RimJ/RimL family protein N-acetyltransferase
MGMNKPDFSGQSQPAGREPVFDFQDLPPSDRLVYRLLTWDNYLHMHEMFERDTNPFVDERFKVPGELRRYVQYQLEHAWYSMHRGGCDWFFFREGRPAGVLHLYDLSRNHTDDRHRRCTIGFATAGPYRGQGYTREAVHHLLDHLFNHFGMEKVLSYTRRENHAAARLLERLRFENCDALYATGEKELKYRYYVLSRERFG